MITEILSTGDEVRSGALADTNAAYIAQKSEEAGLEVVRHNCVGDDRERLIAIFKEIGDRAEIALVTGGLGPTTDDLTTEAAAKAIGAELCLDKIALSQIEAFFQKRKYIMSESNRKQALLPEGAEPLYNPIGTAPGFQLKIGKCLFFFMPGVPFEMKKMLSEQVLPRIAKIQGNKRQFYTVKTISLFGLSESLAESYVVEVNEKFPGIRLGLRAKFPEIQVKLYASGEDDYALNQLVQEATAWVTERLGDKVFSFDNKPMEAVVGDLLREKNATLALAESCTGGLLSHWLTNVSGSSDYFLFSGVVYSNDAKIKVLGVSPETLEKYGAVHEETAKEMAEGARRVAGSTYGLSTTGIAGPTGGTPDKPVGTVCIGIATPDGATGRRFTFTFDSRMMNKKMFAMTALDMLRREIKKS